jgi:protein-tyrosine phosphatase
MRILTVCLGNVCRSPLAQGLLARELQGFPGLAVSSAGLLALVGHPADAMARQVAARHGLDIGGHRAQQVSAGLCQQHDLVLVMERAQKAALEQRFPQVRGKVFHLDADGQIDIADPYRQPMAAFEEAYAVIARGVSDWAHRIRSLV